MKKLRVLSLLTQVYIGAFVLILYNSAIVHSAGYLNPTTGVVHSTKDDCWSDCKPYQTSSEIAAAKAEWKAYTDQIDAINKATENGTLKSGELPTASTPDSTVAWSTSDGWSSIPAQSMESDPNSSSYYNNNNTNKQFSDAWKSNADAVLQKDASGNYTEDSIKAYQALNWLTVDGKIWQETAAALNKEWSAWWAPSWWPIKVMTTEEIPWGNCVCVANFRADGASQDIAQNDLATITKWATKNADWSYTLAKDNGGNSATIRPNCWDMITRKYECIVQPWLIGFQNIFATIIRYLVNIVLLLGVLAIAGLGVAWSWAGWDDAKAKTALKKWGTNIIVWLIILFLFQYILRLLAPWIYI
jgi:hypothetical protein